MKITLRQKPLKDGNASLYLDYYDKGKREYEFLDLTIMTRASGNMNSSTSTLFPTMRPMPVD